MKRFGLQVGGVWLGLCLAVFADGPGVEWGGVLATGRTQNMRFQVGAVLEFEGGVTETTRRFYDVTGRVESQALAESYGTSDFDLKGPFGAIGFSLDMAWKFVRFQIDTMFLAPSVSTTAKRDYYLSIGDDITYQGIGYDHLMIPAGSRLSADVFANVSELVFAFVPIGFQFGESVVVNPSLNFGVLLFGGRYEIDAGLATGVTQYQNPPEDFVVGGKASGLIGMGAPEWGPGVEIRIGKPGELNVALDLRYLFLTYHGSTAFFTTANHRDKDLDFNHQNLRLSGQVEIPMRHMAWTLGIQAQFVDSDGLISSSARDPDVVRARRERFDKEFNFKMHAVYATLGLSF